MAEAWLVAQEPFISSNELGASVDEVEQLIRRHEAFRKAAATWEERFSSLRRLTTVFDHENGSQAPRNIRTNICSKHTHTETDRKNGQTFQRITVRSSLRLPVRSDSLKSMEILLSTEPMCLYCKLMTQ